MTYLRPLSPEDLEVLREVLDEAAPDRESAVARPLSARYRADPEALRRAVRRDLDGRPLLAMVRVRKLDDVEEEP